MHRRPRREGRRASRAHIDYAGFASALTKWSSGRRRAMASARWAGVTVALSARSATVRATRSTRCWTSRNGRPPGPAACGRRTAMPGNRQSARQADDHWCRPDGSAVAGGRTARVGPRWRCLPGLVLCPERPRPVRASSRCPGRSAPVAARRAGPGSGGSARACSGRPVPDRPGCRRGRDSWWPPAGSAPGRFRCRGRD